MGLVNCGRYSLRRVIPAVLARRAKVTTLGLSGLVAVISVGFESCAGSGKAEGQTMLKIQVHIHIVRAVTAFLQNFEWELENQYVGGKPKDA